MLFIQQAKRKNTYQNTIGFVLTNVIIASCLLWTDEYYHCNRGSEFVVVCEIKSKVVVCENKSKNIINAIGVVNLLWGSEFVVVCEIKSQVVVCENKSKI